MAKCWHHSEIVKDNCISCKHWDSIKERCRDEAILLAEWEKRYKGLEWMMRENRGIKLE